MDAQRTSFVLTIAALLAGTALAGPPSTSTADFAGANNWSSAGTTTAPTISRSSTDRYGNPQYSYPQNTQPQSTNGRVQAGTAGYPAQSSNPFATQPAAPPASPTNNLAPPPWPTGAAGTPAPPPTSPWNSSSIPATPVDRSLLATPTAPPASSAWSSIGSTIAAPPLLTPQLPSSFLGRR
jgi:hypothetical protein